MGLITSLAGKGLPITPVVGMVTDKFHDEFVKKKIKEFPDFHLAVLSMFISVNEALPGKHWNVPPYQDIKNCFMEREGQPNEELKNEIVLKFLKEHIQPNKLDKFSLMIGLATPPAAMAAKKAGEGVPQLKFMKSVPDVLFVPGATLLALTGIRFSRIVFLQQKHLKSEGHLLERNHIGTSDS